MNEQLSLFNSPEPNVSSYNLILAIFPDTHTAERIGALGNSIRERYGMYGKVRPTKHLHVSLPFPCNPRIKPETTIEKVLMPYADRLHRLHVRLISGWIG